MARPTDAVRHKFQGILTKAKAYERLQRIMRTTTNDEIFMKAMQIALDRGFGRPVQDFKPVDDQGNYKPFQIFMPAQITGQEGRVG